MKHWILLLLVGLGSNAPAQSAQRLAADAYAAYQSGSYAQADSLYTLAREQSPDVYAYVYNAALAKYRLTALDSARYLFEYSLALPDSQPAAVHYNLGNIDLLSWAKQDLELGHVSLLIEEASATEGLNVQERLQKYLEKDSLLARQQELLTGKMDALNNAIDRYKTTLKLDPSDEDARYNLLFARGKIPPPDPEDPDPENDDDTSDDSKSTREAEVKAKAFEYIQKGQFNQAMRYLEREVANDPDLKPLESLMEKLGVILDILHRS